MKLTLITAVAFVLFFAGNLPASADEKRHEEHGMEMDHAAIACTIPVHLTQEAEMKMGGRLYDGPLPKAAKQKAGGRMGVMASSNMAMIKDEMKEMEGSHNVHKGIRGGEFIMVPNHLHHMEVVYSQKCGFQLFLYNAFTEPIRVDRFQAFILVLPESGDDLFEIMRFLAPSADGSFLHASITHQHDNPKTPKAAFEVELYMKFPESIHPRKFDLIIEPGAA